MTDTPKPQAMPPAEDEALGKEGTSASTADDHTKPLRRALAYGAAALGIIALVSLLGWGLGRGMPGVWGVVLGAAIGGGFVLLTAASVLFTAHSSPGTTMGAVLGGWLLKIIVLIAVLSLIRDLEFYDRLALFVTVVLALVATLATEVWGIMTTRVTYVS